VKRTQIYLDEDLDRELRDAALSEGRSAASLIREAVRVYLTNRHPPRRNDPINEMIGALDGGSTRASEDVDEVLYARARGRPRKR
jgi:hypothetical protein